MRILLSSFRHLCGKTRASALPIPAVILEPDSFTETKSTDSNRGDLRPIEYIHKRKESPQEGVGGRVKKKSTGRLAESLDGFRKLWNYEIMTQIVRGERATSNSVAKSSNF